MLSWLRSYLPLRLQQKLLHQSGNDDALQQYLSVAIPSLMSDISSLEFLVLDFETTGLDASRDNILSVGYTVVRDNKVVLKNNTYSVVSQSDRLQHDNVSIHKITDSMAQRGDDIKPVLDKLLVDLAGKVLVAHHASIETKFLNAACQRHYGCGLPVRVVDTMEIEKKRLLRRHQTIKTNQLRLFNIRKAAGLPRYKAHNALEDAIATAELFLLQISHVCGQHRCQLKDLY